MNEGNSFKYQPRVVSTTETIRLPKHYVSDLSKRVKDILFSFDDFVCDRLWDQSGASIHENFHKRDASVLSGESQRSDAVFVGQINAASGVEKKESDTSHERFRLGSTSAG